ncbi:MAG: hypothetical protein A2X94_09970 [Bdellovibrionales bacterium GWB1_55_8]|nr:MAG: hypothetical protein A2X94_09970 [Bdellovibrionales bacterium GWB1_55_8]
MSLPGCDSKITVSDLGSLPTIPSTSAPEPAPVTTSWQTTIEQHFDLVDTFDELQDWTPGAQWYSSSGCATCASNFNLPKKLDGTPSIWTLWNNKGLSFQYIPAIGTFAIGDVITGTTSGTTATVRQIWNVDEKWYIQLTSNPGVLGTSTFTAGEAISSGAKTGINLQWPLFIANQGASHTWRGTGKTLVMDLGDNSTSAGSTNPSMEGLGAQRLGVYFGDGVSGKSGYKKLHVFLMMKINPEFFNTCQTPGTGCLADGFDTVSVIKIFGFDSGFTNISRWGTDADRAKADPNAPNYYRLDEYGLNNAIFNFFGGGLSFSQSLFFSGIRNGASISSGSLYTYARLEENQRIRNGTSLDIESYIAQQEWFGIEMAYDIGTPDNYDGSTDFWIYDASGNEKGHFSATGEKHLAHFDHYYNKFVLGGNRLSANNGTQGLDARLWIDDFIIDADRIAPTYFQLLSAEQN